MANKIIDITHSATKYDILSQTPKNYNSDNYFLKELQDKINADWRYRPNRVDIEYENDWGEQTYDQIEAVIQTVRTENGTNISNDCKNLVFRDLQQVNKSDFKIGSKFRFSNTHDLEAPEKEKNVWLVTNMNDAKFTSSVVVERCNGFIGSSYKDEQGLTKYHYEPVIQGRELTSTRFSLNDVVISPQSQLLIICQHNSYTKDYFINQRFIIGYDKVYRITAINKFYSNSTFDSENVGLMRIYLEITESSQYDNFETHIAYQNENEVHIKDDEQNGEYTINYETPSEIPPMLPMDTALTFTPILAKNEDVPINGIYSFEVTIKLNNLPETVAIDNYVEYTQDPATGNVQTFTLKRKRKYLGGNLVVCCKLPASQSPSGSDVISSFEMLMS